MTLAAFLVGMVGPLLARILTSLGLSLVTVTGLTVAITSFKDTLISQVGGIPSDGLQLAGLFGIWTAIGMMLGAFTFCITWASTAGFWKLARSS